MPAVRSHIRPAPIHAAARGHLRWRRQRAGGAGGPCKPEGQPAAVDANAAAAIEAEAVVSLYALCVQDAAVVAHAGPYGARSSAAAAPAAARPQCGRWHLVWILASVRLEHRQYTLFFEFTNCITVFQVLNLFIELHPVAGAIQGGWSACLSFVTVLFVLSVCV